MILELCHMRENVRCLLNTAYPVSYPVYPNWGGDFPSNIAGAVQLDRVELLNEVLVKFTFPLHMSRVSL